MFPSTKESYGFPVALGVCWGQAYQVQYLKHTSTMSTKQCCGGTSELAQSAGLKGFPQTDDELRKAQDALAKDLEKLSLDEHERALFDIHGIAQVDDEDPAREVVEERLQELQQELDALKEKPFYDRAYNVNPAFVEDKDFRLMFLRCFKFIAKDAAALMEQHFRAKTCLFAGEKGQDPSKDEILGRHVLLSDLTEEDMENLKIGHCQIFPSRDAAGRTIFTSNKRLKLAHKNPGSVVRTCWTFDIESSIKYAMYNVQCAICNTNSDCAIQFIRVEEIGI